MATRAKSKPPSGTNPSARSEPPEADPFAYTYFLDESISGKTLVSAMRGAGYSVKVLAEEFGSGTPDLKWLPVAAEKQWVLIGKDDRWRYRSEEKAILIRAKARAFIFVSKTARREEIAQAILGALPRMAQLLATQPPPFIGRILLSGYVGLVYPSDSQT
ncbi:MAG TPA: hypothetical protein VEK57_27155 [Thermoanaerobaculia bacterium]|nr:hypothetical protein [Thermoanaerobaculia bacterium]